MIYIPTSSSPGAKQMVLQITNYWQQRAKFIRNRRFVCALHAIGLIPASVSGLGLLHPGGNQGAGVGGSGNMVPSSSSSFSAAAGGAGSGYTAAAAAAVAAMTMMTTMKPFIDDDDNHHNNQNNKRNKHSKHNKHNNSNSNSNNQNNHNLHHNNYYTQSSPRDGDMTSSVALPYLQHQQQHQQQHGPLGGGGGGGGLVGSAAALPCAAPSESDSTKINKHHNNTASGVKADTDNNSKVGKVHYLIPPLCTHYHLSTIVETLINTL